jgi:hypothetical protein
MEMILVRTIGGGVQGCSQQISIVLGSRILIKTKAWQLAIMQHLLSPTESGDLLINPAQAPRLLRDNHADTCLPVGGAIRGAKQIVTYLKR